MIRAVAVLTALTVPAAAQTDAPPAPPPGWVARGVARLVALDKVSARATPIEAPVGETVRYSTLAITVRACVVRPPDQAPDATAFLDIVSTPNGPSFHGWQIVSAPAVSGFEHPTLDVRLVGCR